MSIKINSLELENVKRVKAVDDIDRAVKRDGEVIGCENCLDIVTVRGCYEFYG